MIPYSRQKITQADIDAVTSVLKSDFLTQGDQVPKLEQLFCEKFNCEFAVAVSNATSALHITYLALGLQPDDWLWTSPITFLSSSNAALFIGAKVKFIDIDEESFNISPTKLNVELEKAAKLNQLPKIITCVHLAGNSANMQEIKQIADKYGVKLVEDAAHAMGAKYLNSYIGSCQYSDACVFSMHPVKIITSGEGGLITTNNEEVAKKLQLLRSHGVTRENAPKDEAWTYEQLLLGFNYRMTDFQAALGASQAQRLDEVIAKRNQLADLYLEKLANLPIKLPKVEATNISSWHLFVIRFDNSQQRKFVFNYLRSKDIGVNVHYIPVPTQPFYKKLGYSLDENSNAQQYYNTCLSLPLFLDLSTTQIDFIIENLTQALEDFKCQ